MADPRDSKIYAPTAEKDVALGETHDIAANLYLEAEQITPEELETEGAKVLRLIDWKIMPMVGDHSNSFLDICFFSDFDFFV